MDPVKFFSDVSGIFRNKIYLSFPPKKFLKNNFLLPKYLIRKSKYKISIRVSSLWNKDLSSTEKERQEPHLFKRKLISKLLKMNDKVK